MTGEIQETAPCAAITEKRQNRLSGCVGVFFQLFDWNRRFAKKKLFSRKSLLPGKQASKRFGGNDKLLKSKLNLVDEENRGNFQNLGEIVEFKKQEMRSPSLVARLMGLESIPSNHKDKSKKKKPIFSKFDEEEEDNGLDKTRPQKMQRTMVKKFGSDAMQIKNVLTRVRKHHQYTGHHQKLASPVRSPRLSRRSSRLIDAASRILEPGKRNLKPGIAFPSSFRCENVGKEPVEASVLSDSLVFRRGFNDGLASCKACGASGSSPVAKELGKNIACGPESSSIQRCKRSVFWGNEEPFVSVSDKIERKGLSRGRYDFNGKDKVASPPVVKRSDFRNQMLQRERLSAPAKAKDFIAMNRDSISKNHYNSRTKFQNFDMNLQRISHTRAEESSSRSVLARKRRLNETTFSPLKLGSSHSQTKSVPNPNPISERNRRTPPFEASSLSLIQQKLKELTSQEENVLQNKSVSLIIHELLSSLALNQPRDIDMAYAETACRRKGKAELWSFSGNANSDYTSPGSVLDASFSNESCFSNSFDNITGQIRLPQEPDWDVLEDSAKSNGNYQAIARLLSHVSNVLHSLTNTGLISTHQRFTIARQVIIHTELLLNPTTQENYFISSEFFDELMIYAARSDHLANLPGLTGGFLVDAMVEYLERRNVLFRLKPLNVEGNELICSVLEEVPKWAELDRIGVDEMETWLDFETDLVGVGSEIAYEILWCLVGELVMDLGKFLMVKKHIF